MAAQFTAMKGLSAVGETRCRKRAHTSFPEPVSPWKRIGSERAAIRRRRASMRLICGEMPSTPSAERCSRADRISRAF
jgi:hypothetical protein